MPDSTFINVDFPAPFSPHNACISPSCTSKLTSSNALTPGNSFVMCLICNIVFATALPSYTLLASISSPMIAPVTGLSFRSCAVCTLDSDSNGNKCALPIVVTAFCYFKSASV